MLSTVAGASVVIRSEMRLYQWMPEKQGSRKEANEILSGVKVVTGAISARAALMADLAAILTFAAMQSGGSPLPACSEYINQLENTSLNRAYGERGERPQLKQRRKPKKKPGKIK